MFSVRVAPDLWRPYFDLLNETAAAGGRMFAQVHSRALNVLLLLQDLHPPLTSGMCGRTCAACPLKNRRRGLRTRRSRRN